MFAIFLQDFSLPDVEHTFDLVGTLHAFPQFDKDGDPPGHLGLEAGRAIQTGWSLKTFTPYIP